MTARTDGAMVALSSAVALVAVTFYGSAVLGRRLSRPSGTQGLADVQRATEIDVFVFVPMDKAVERHPRSDVTRRCRTASCRSDGPSLRPHG